VATLVVALAGCGDQCETNVDTATFELRNDELDKKCEEVCAEAIDDGSTFDGCERSEPGVDPVTITCRFSVVGCDYGRF
jgi:hypothetical protein